MYLQRRHEMTKKTLTGLAVLAGLILIVAVSLHTGPKIATQSVVQAPVASNVPTTTANDLVHLATLLLWIVVAGCGLVLYFLPTIAAKRNKKKNVEAIGILNFFLGWTLLGWIGALVWASTKD
jgi:nitric oxide reductase large subunit